MKKNLMSVLILALVLVNLVFTAILTFSIVPATSNANKLIEEVAKSTRRKETVDDTYMSALYEKINALYRLDQIGDSEKKDFGALPTASVVLIAAFVTAWTLIITFSIIGFIKKRKNER